MQAGESFAGKLMEGLRNAGAEVGAELSRLGTQGAAELSSAIFHGSSFVPYGAGQQPAHHEPLRSHGAEAEPPGQEMERDGMGM